MAAPQKLPNAVFRCILVLAMALWGDAANVTLPPGNGTCADEVGQPLIPAMIGIILLLGQIISYLPQVIVTIVH